MLGLLITSLACAVATESNDPAPAANVPPAPSSARRTMKVAMPTIADISSWQVAGRSPRATLGVSLGTNGDFNGDGAADLVVGGATSQVGGNARGGAVLVFDGPLTPSESPADSSSASAILFGTMRDEASIVCPVGDLDGDGADDLVVGHPRAGSTNMGSAYIARGPLAAKVDLAREAQAFFGSADGQMFGGCAGPGDVDGDGLDDLVLSAPGLEARSADDRGSVYLLQGPVAQETVGDADLILRGADPREYIGSTVAALGDLSGDGTQDYGVTNYQIGETSPDGASAYLVTDLATGIVHPADVGVTVHGADRFAHGFVVASAGDVDGDGYDDVAFGGRSAGDAGVVVLLQGPFGDEPNLDLLDDAGPELYSSAGGPSRWLSFVSPLGDWQGDGAEWLAVGDAAFANDDAAASGECADGATDCMVGAIYFVSEPIAPGSHDLAVEANRIEGVYGHGFLGGGGPRGGTDLSGDGLPDLAVSAWGASADADRGGIAYVLFGGDAP